MKFTESFSTTVVFGRPRRVEISASLLNKWWNAHAGPQTAEELVEANSRTIKEMIAFDVTEGLIDPKSDDLIVLAEGDMDDETGDLLPAENEMAFGGA